MEMVESKTGCVDCGEIFLRPKQRGRPPVRCENCRVNYQSDIVTVEINEEKLYHGPKEALNGDKSMLPQGNREAQCPKCWRIFVSDNSCEGHKDYQTEAICRDPASLGYVAIEHKDRPVWKKPMSQQDIDRLYGGK